MWYSETYYSDNHFYLFRRKNSASFEKKKRKEKRKKTVRQIEAEFQREGEMNEHFNTLHLN